MPKTLPALALALFALLPAASRAAEQDHALLSTFCDAANIKGSTCTRAKGYPNAPKRGCDVALRAERYGGKFLGAGNPLLVVFYDSGCESHATDNGGAAVFEQTGGADAFKSFAPGMIGSECVTLKDAQRDRLICLTGHMGQGLLEGGVAEMHFKVDAARRIALSLDRVLTTEDSAGAYGANTVTCKEPFKVFDVSKLKVGPRTNTVSIEADYADAAVIKAACAKGATKPPEAIGELPPGDAYVGEDQQKSGTLVVDLATGKVTPK